LKVLLVDDNQARADAVTRQLLDSGVPTVLRPDAGERLAVSVLRHAPNVVIVDMSRPDRDSLDGIRELSSQKPHPIIMFVDQDDSSFMQQAIDAGVISYNVVGSSAPDVKPIVMAAVAIFQRYQNLAGKLLEAEALLAERITIQRAKALMMQQRKMTEPQAYQWLRRQAMNSGKRMVEIASEILRLSGERE
jgi:response regulator NasT